MVNQRLPAEGLGASWTSLNIVCLSTFAPYSSVLCVPEVRSRARVAVPRLSLGHASAVALLGLGGPQAHAPEVCPWAAEAFLAAAAHSPPPPNLRTTEDQSRDSLPYRNPGKITPPFTHFPPPFLNLGCGGWGFLCRPVPRRPYPELWASSPSFLFPSLFYLTPTARGYYIYMHARAPAHASHNAPPPLTAGNLGPLCFTCRFRLVKLFSEVWDG